MKKENQRNYYRRVKEKLLNHYGNRCACCGETEEAFLTIDHVNGNGSLERKQYRTTVQMGVSIIRRGFPSDYQILCFNCNNGKRRTGVCPHQYSSKQICRERIL